MRAYTASATYIRYRLYRACGRSWLAATVAAGRPIVAVVGWTVAGIGAVVGWLILFMVL